MKVCKDCGESKPLEEFHKTPKSADGRNVRCKPCRKKFRARYKETTFAYSLKDRFNITAEQYNEILSRQNGRCGLCKSPEPQGNPYWQVDHDHNCCPNRRTCGACIRGILCSECNFMLGYYEKIRGRSHIRLPILDAYLDKPALVL